MAHMLGECLGTEHPEREIFKTLSFTDRVILSACSCAGFWRKVPPAGQPPAALQFGENESQCILGKLWRNLREPTQLRTSKGEVSSI